MAELERRTGPETWVGLSRNVSMLTNMKEIEKSDSMPLPESSNRYSVSEYLDIDRALDEMNLAEATNESE
jgi:hypothetical protein